MRSRRLLIPFPFIFAVLSLLGCKTRGMNGTVTSSARYDQSEAFVAQAVYCYGAEQAEILKAETVLGHSGGMQKLITETEIKKTLTAAEPFVAKYVGNEDSKYPVANSKTVLETNERIDALDTVRRAL